MLQKIKEIEFKYIAYGILIGLAFKFALNKWKEKKD
jgi:hypothetical protein